MSKTDVIEVEGVVTDSFPNAMFEVELLSLIHISELDPRPHHVAH